MKNFTTQFSIKRAFLLSALIALSSFSFGQENPWETKKSENPWGKQAETVKKEEPKETIQTVDTVTVAATVIDTLTNNVAADTSIIVKEQTVKEPAVNATVVKTQEKNEDGKIKIVRTEGEESYNLYQLSQSAEAKYNGGVGLSVSALTMAIPGVNVIALPINIASIFVPTPQENTIINDFRNDNPKATEKEVKAVRKGIRKKRAKRTGGGMAIGTGIFAVFMIALFN